MQHAATAQISDICAMRLLAHTGPATGTRVAALNCLDIQSDQLGEAMNLLDSLLTAQTLRRRIAACDVA